MTIEAVVDRVLVPAARGRKCNRFIY